LHLHVRVFNMKFTCIFHRFRNQRGCKSCFRK